VKGVGKTFDTATFKTNLIEGRFVHFPDSGYSNEIVLSKVIAAKINTKVGDLVTVHFFQNPPRFRRLKVTGIYETNLSEYFDGKVIIGDIRLIARLNDWADSVAGGLEVFVKDVNRIDEAGKAMSEMIDYDMDIIPVSGKYAQVFEWLHLLSRQVNILLVIILIVVCVNMISIILILVMERTQMIGMLKALGATDKLIRSIFIYNGVSLIVKGLLLGNAIGLGLCYLQYQFKLIKLNPEDYYMSFVPVSWHWEIIGILNLLTFLVVTVVLLLPTAIISRINPIKAIRFD
jgi:lipoprotein-releasing system permease protein